MITEIKGKIPSITDLFQWEPKGLSNEKISSDVTANHRLSSKLIWLNNSRIRERIKGSCLKQDKVTSTPKDVVNLFNVYELDRCSQALKANFALKDCLFGAVKLTINTGPDKCSYSGYGVGLDSRSLISFPNVDWHKNIVIFRVDNSSSVHIDNKKKDILVLGNARIRWYYDNNRSWKFYWFFEIRNKICLTLHYNGSKSFLFVNATKMYQFKAKHPEIKPYMLGLQNISKDFTANNIKKGLNSSVYDFPVDYNIIDINDIINIHKYWIKWQDIK